MLRNCFIVWLSRDGGIAFFALRIRRRMSYPDLRSLQNVLRRNQDAWRPRLGLCLNGLREFAMRLSVGRGFGYGFSLESPRDYLQGMLIGIQRVL